MVEKTVSVFDVAKYILERRGVVSGMKLQKLVYYAQAWSLVWDELPLFEDEIQAWVSGPVVYTLFDAHRGMYLISSDDLPSGDSNKLSDDQKDTINAVLNYYGAKDSQWLSDLTHMEDPWIQAREGLLPNERGNNIITLASMEEYYSSLL